jgi:hypothetical protein
MPEKNAENNSEEQKAIFMRDARRQSRHRSFPAKIEMISGRNYFADCKKIE